MDEYHGRFICGWTLKTLQVANAVRKESPNGDPAGTHVPSELDVGLGCVHKPNAYPRVG